jgi:hypothetical protein
MASAGSAGLSGRPKDTTPVTAVPVASDDVETELLKLKKLFDAGLLSQNVYEVTQAKLMGV